MQFPFGTAYLQGRAIHFRGCVSLNRKITLHCLGNTDLSPGTQARDAGASSSFCAGASAHASTVGALQHACEVVLLRYRAHREKGNGCRPKILDGRFPKIESLQMDQVFFTFSSNSLKPDGFNEQKTVFFWGGLQRWRSLKLRPKMIRVDNLGSFAS